MATCNHIFHSNCLERLEAPKSAVRGHYRSCPSCGTLSGFVPWKPLSLDVVSADSKAALSLDAKVREDIADAELSALEASAHLSFFVHTDMKQVERRCGSRLGRKDI